MYFILFSLAFSKQPPCLNSDSPAKPKLLNLPKISNLKMAPDLHVSFRSKLQIALSYLSKKKTFSSIYHFHKVVG